MQPTHASMQEQLASIRNLVTNQTQPTPEVSVSAREADLTAEESGFADSSQTVPGELYPQGDYSRRGSSRAKQFGRVESVPAQVKLQMGSSTATVPLSSEERKAVIGNVLDLQRASVQKEKAGVWTHIATAALSLVGIVGLGLAMYKGTTSKTHNET